jgi:hypothetical protein
LSPTIETAYFGHRFAAGELVGGAIFTRTLGIVPLFALPTSVGW